MNSAKGSRQLLKSEAKARAIIKSEMVRREVTFEMLAEMIKEYGHQISGKNLNAKVNKARFSAAFFLEVLECLKTKAIDLE